MTVNMCNLEIQFQILSVLSRHVFEPVPYKNNMIFLIDTV